MEIMAKNTLQKTCQICGCTKPHDDFMPNRRICLSCFPEYKRLHKRKSPDRSDGVRYSKAADRIVEYRNGYQRKYWSPQMISTLRRLYPTTKNEELASMFDISMRTLGRKVAELGLSKDPEWMRNVIRNNAFYGSQACKKVCAKNLIKARQALAIKYNNPNFTRKDRERYGIEQNI